MWEITTADAAETERLGELLGELVQAGDAVLLSGDLGAGKTTFTRGLARGVKVRQPVTSPTFTLLHEYDGGRLPVYHFDLYRWPPGDDLAELGLPDYLYDEGVTVVEWPSALGSWTPADYVGVELLLDPAGRRLRFHGVGERGIGLAEALREAAHAVGRPGPDRAGGGARC